MLITSTLYTSQLTRQSSYLGINDKIPIVMPERRSQNLQDHDLLIELRTEMQGVRNDIKDLKDNTSARVEDHETRIRFIEKYVWGAIAVIGILNFIGIGGLILLATKLFN